MTDQNTDRSKMSSDCFAGMAEMMRSVMSKKDAYCCPCAEKITQMMRKCCQVQNKEENATETPNQDAPE